MIQVGDTFDGFDDQGHLYVVLSRPTVHDRIAVANLTSHYAERPRHNEECVIIRPEEHPWVRRVSCMFYQRANFVRYSMLDDGTHDGAVRSHPSCSPGLLRRIQEGALAAEEVGADVKAAIWDSLVSDSQTPDP